MISIIFTLTHSIGICLGAVVSQLTEPFGYDVTENGIFGIFFIVGGLIGTVISGVILDLTRRYQRMTYILTFIINISTAMGFLSLPSKNDFLVSLNMLIFGGSAFPIVALFYSYSIELTFPIQEGVSNGLALLVANSASSALVHIFDNCSRMPSCRS